MELWAATDGWIGCFRQQNLFQNSSTKKDNIIFLKSLCCLRVMSTEKRISHKENQFCHVMPVITSGEKLLLILQMMNISGTNIHSLVQPCQSCKLRTSLCQKAARLHITCKQRKKERKKQQHIKD